MSSYPPPRNQIKPEKTYLFLLNKCTKLTHLKQIQASLTTTGLITTHPFLNATLFRTLISKFKSYNQALQILSNSNFYSCFAYNTLVRELSLSPTPHAALNVFVKMLHPNSPDPNSSSFTFALKACSRSLSHSSTKRVHALAIVTGFYFCSHVAITALYAYASCRNMDYSRKIFDDISTQEVIKWNAMITGYIQNGNSIEAFKLFHRMFKSGIAPTDVTIMVVLTGCGQNSNFILGSQVHAFISKGCLSFETHINVGTALLDMYAKCRLMKSSRKVFDEMRIKDTGVWNALIRGYVSNNDNHEAIQLFKDLPLSGLKPDKRTLVNTLRACANSGALDVGKSIHEYIQAKYSSIDIISATSLIEMYSKCGCIDLALEVFGKIRKKDTMAWTSMICALASNGKSDEALDLFDAMKKCDCKPDGVTFVGVLNACRHGGYVDIGLKHFNSMMWDYRMRPRVEHYGCMIDMYSRNGRLKEALGFMETMEVEANAVIWRSFLSACRNSLEVELAEVAVEKLRRMGSGHCGDYVLLSNVYALKGMWEDARRVRSLMKEEEVRKKPAFTSMEFDRGLEEDGVVDEPLYALEA